MGGVDRIIPTFNEQRDMAASPSIFTFNFYLLTFALSQLSTTTNKTLFYRNLADQSLLLFPLSNP